MAETVTCERWLCAPYSEMALEHGLVDEVREGRRDVAALGVQQRQHVGRHGAEQGRRHGGAAVFFQQRHEAGHVRPLFFGGQRHGQGPVGHGALGRAIAALDQHGVAHATDTHALDRDVPGVRRALDVGHHDGGVDRRIHFGLPVQAYSRQYAGSLGI